MSCPAFTEYLAPNIQALDALQSSAAEFLILGGETWIREYRAIAAMSDTWLPSFIILFRWCRQRVCPTHTSGSDGISWQNTTTKVTS